MIRLLVIRGVDEVSDSPNAVESAVRMVPEIVLLFIFGEVSPILMAIEEVLRTAFSIMLPFAVCSFQLELYLVNAIAPTCPLPPLKWILALFVPLTVSVPFTSM